MQGGPATGVWSVRNKSLRLEVHLARRTRLAQGQGAADLKADASAAGPPGIVSAGCWVFGCVGVLVSWCLGVLLFWSPGALEPSNSGALKSLTQLGSKMVEKHRTFKCCDFF